VIPTAADFEACLVERARLVRTGRGPVEVLAGYDADLAAGATRLTNRLHDALLHVHPALVPAAVTPGRRYRHVGIARGIILSWP